MVDGVIKAETPSAASPATDEAARDAAMLSRMADLAEALAAGFQARGVAALEAGDLDRAGKTEAGFSNLFLGIRRAIALKAKLRQQREEARHKAETHRDRLQDKKDDRRHAVAEGVSRAIAVVKPEARERFTADLWVRLTETERIDADLADTALPIETLILRLGRQIGLSDRAIAYGLDPAAAKARADRAAAAPKRQGWSPDAAPISLPPRRTYDYTPGTYRTIPAADLGLPGDEIYNLNTTTGEVFDPDGKLFRTLDDRPPDLVDTGPPSATAPPDPDPPPPPETDAERRRREYEAHCRLYGLTPYPP